MEILLKIKNATPSNIKSKLNKALKSFGTDFKIVRSISHTTNTERQQVTVKLKDFTRENADYKVTKALAGVGKALNCDFICKSIDTSKCSLEMTTDCNGNIIHRWKRIDDEYLLNQKQLFSNAVKLFIERGYTQGTPITILNKTPEILQEKAAIPNVKITVDPKILRKILTKPKTPKEHNHFMPVNLVNDLPVQLTKPLAILKDIENNHTIIVTEQFYKNRPVIAAMEVAKNIGGNITVNSLRSFHDKRCESFFDFWNKKQVLFEDKEKTKALREFLHVRGFDSLNPSSEISIPKSINKSINHAEKPSYQALQDIIDNSNAEVEKIKLQAYNFICKFLGLPKISGIDINKSFTESEHPRAENGQFTSKGESTYKEEIEQALKENVTPMPENIPFTKENYDKLFKNGINTPIGKVKLGENQFDKLKDKDRQKILAPMCETLKDPSVVIFDNGTKLFCKEFSRQDKKNKLIVSVVIDRDNLQISISTHEKRLSQLQNKSGRILYKKSTDNHGTVRKSSVADPSNISESINKSINDELTVNGKIIFDPIWGIPLKQKDYVQMIGTLENFLSRRLKETEKRLLLQSSALGHLIALSKNGQTKLLLETVKLKNIVYKGKTFDQLCTDYDTLKKNFDKVTDNEIEKLKFIEDQIGVYVTNAKDVTIKVIKDIYYDAVINHKSKSQIAQEMYDKLGFLNRSWDTIARTESNNLKNHAFLIGSLNENRKTYFRRRVGSYNTCKICASHRNKIALWVNSPLPDDKINDEIADIAIWSGKTNIGRNQKDWWIPEGSTHPNCFCEWEKLLDEEIKYFRKSFTESDHPRAENGRFTSKDESTETSNVNHDGEYVLTKKGSKDFGEITRDIGRQPGKIRLRIGTHDENTDKGEGEVHIERPKRLKQLKMYGFNNARDFVEYTCENFDEVYASGMALLLVKKENGFTCVVRLTPLKDEEFYDVKTVYVMPERTIKNKLAKEEIRLIWQKPNSPNVETFKSEHLKSDNGIPIGFIKGTPDPSNISKSINKSNKENKLAKNGHHLPKIRGNFPLISLNSL